MRALSSSTSDIPSVKGPSRGGDGDLSLFAKSTADAVREGAKNAAAGAVDRAFRALQSNAYDPVLVLTGGHASRILNALCETPLHRPHLVLRGLATMLDNPQ
jgi:pantothenate kinase type III